MDFTALPGSALVRFRAGDTLMSAGEKIDYVYYLVEGIVYRNIISKNGEETTVAIKFSTGTDDIKDLLGVLALYTLDGTLGYSSFIAKTDCKCWRIPLRTAREIIDKDPDILRQLLFHAMQTERTMLERYHRKKEYDTVSHLCAILLEQSDFTREHELIISPFHNTDLARLLGVHPVTISRILGALQQENVLEKRNGKWLVKDKIRLSRIADSEETISYRYRKQHSRLS